MSIRLAICRLFLPYGYRIEGPTKFTPVPEGFTLRRATIARKPRKKHIEGDMCAMTSEGVEKLERLELAKGLVEEYRREGL